MINPWSIHLQKSCLGVFIWSIKTVLTQIFRLLASRVCIVFLPCSCPLFFLLVPFSFCLPPSSFFLASSAFYLPAVSFSVLLLSNLCSAAYLYRSYVASKLHQSPTYFQERYADEESMRSVLHHRCLFCSMHVELHTLDFSQCEFDNEN